MASVLGTELIQVALQCLTCPLEELNHDRIVRSIVDKPPQVLDLNIMCLVAKHVQIKKVLIVHDQYSGSSCVYDCIGARCGAENAACGHVVVII